MLCHTILNSAPCNVQTFIRLLAFLQLCYTWCRSMLCSEMLVWKQVLEEETLKGERDVLPEGLEMNMESMVSEMKQWKER